MICRDFGFRLQPAVGSRRTDPQPQAPRAYCGLVMMGVVRPQSLARGAQICRPDADVGGRVIPEVSSSSIMTSMHSFPLEQQRGDARAVVVAQGHRRGGLVGWVRDLGMPKTRVADMRARTGAAPAASPEQVAAFNARLRAHHSDA